MHVDTQKIMKLAAGAEMPQGFIELPTELQGDAARLIGWAAEKRKAKARKGRRKLARRSRKLSRHR